MKEVTLKSRAVAFACCVGAAAFILAVLATATDPLDAEMVPRALSVAIVCAVLSWASAERALSGVAGAIDATVARVAAAADGDLATPVPPVVGKALPQLSSSLGAMFDQVRGSLESATTLALFDPVTQLANRTHFRHEVERAMQTPSRTGLSVLAFIDLDHFKIVNDTHGHAQGDQLLIRVANRLRAVAAAETDRQADRASAPIVGRLAGDEFTLFVPDVASRADAERLGEALLAALVNPFEVAGQEVPVGASIGIALSPEHGTTMTALMRAADVAMYHAKASGRGQYQFFAEKLAQRMARRTQLESELRSAISHNEFGMVFQPQVVLADGSVQACECLLRWNHPVDGMRLPGSFIDCAEESGLIFEIGDWAMTALARRVAGWPTDALAPRIAVNLSPRQIARPEFFARLNGEIARQQADLSLIEFEVSEAVLMQCGPTMLEQIARLRERGATIAIDDFGSGSSSLARLRSLPFDTIKLDASLVTGIETDAAARDILQSVIGLVHSLGARSVAEGVETQAQVDMLRVMGCSAAQGYALAPPMTEAAYRTWAGSAASRMRA